MPDQQPAGRIGLVYLSILAVTVGIVGGFGADRRARPSIRRALQGSRDGADRASGPHAVWLFKLAELFAAKDRITGAAGRA